MYSVSKILNNRIAYKHNHMHAFSIIDIQEIALYSYIYTIFLNIHEMCVATAANHCILCYINFIFCCIKIVGILSSI